MNRGTSAGSRGPRRGQLYVVPRVHGRARDEGEKPLLQSFAQGNSSDEKFRAKKYTAQSPEGR